MKFLPKIFLASLAIACITLFLTKCEKQADESVTSSLSNSTEGNVSSSVGDRSPVTSCIECDLEWRFLCDDRRCDGGNYDRTSVTLRGNIFREDGGNGTCCFPYSCNVTWLGAQTVSQWQQVDPGILKTSVYPALNPELNCATLFPMLVAAAHIKDANGGYTQIIPGTLKIQFRKKGDNTGTTLTQHNIPLNNPASPCQISQDPQGTAVTSVPITIENNCKVTSTYMVTPENTNPNPYLCPSGEGGH